MRTVAIYFYGTLIFFIVFFQKCKFSTSKDDNAKYYFTQIKDIPMQQIDTIYNDVSKCEDRYCRYFKKLNTDDYVEVRWSLDEGVHTKDSVFIGEIVYINTSASIQEWRFYQSPFRLGKTSFEASNNIYNRENKITVIDNLSNSHEIFVYTQDYKDKVLGLAHGVLYVDKSIGIIYTEFFFRDNKQYNNKSITYICNNEHKNKTIKSIVDKIRQY